MKQNGSIFVVSSMRSGSTLLRYLLASHPSLACPPESKFIAALEQTLRYPQMLTALASIGAHKDMLYSLYRHMIEEILGQYAAKIGKRRWVDKTPTYYRCLPFIDEVFNQEAQYIFLVRDPLDTVYSMEAFVGRHPSVIRGDPDIVRMCSAYGASRVAWARYWIEVYEAIDEFAQSCSHRCHTVTYEDLAQEPLDTMKRIVRFLGEAPDGIDLNVALRNQIPAGYQDDKIQATSSVHTDSIGCSKVWTKREQESIWQIVESTAVKFQYSR